MDVVIGVLERGNLSLWRFIAHHGDERLAATAASRLDIEAASLWSRNLSHQRVDVVMSYLTASVGGAVAIPWSQAVFPDCQGWDRSAG